MFINTKIRGQMRNEYFTKVGHAILNTSRINSLFYNISRKDTIWWVKIKQINHGNIYQIRKQAVIVNSADRLNKE